MGRLTSLAIAAAALGVVPAAAQHHGQHSQPAQHGTGSGAAQQPGPAARGGEDHAHAGEAERRAVLATVDRLFAALAAKSSAGILAEVVPDGRATANDLASRRVDSQSWSAFAGHVERIPGRPVERLIDPHVHVEGDIAMIWSRYEIELDGRFLHCGIDHFDLVRLDGRWKVLNLTWTQQTQGCPGRDGLPGEGR